MAKAFYAVFRSIGIHTIRAHSCLLIAAGLFSSVAAQTTNIEITNTIQQADIKRLGINLGDQTYWDSGQMTKNLVLRNPGFEGMVYQSVLRCGFVSATSCRDDNEYASWPAGFWSGASYEFISGAAKGRRGTVSNSTAPSPGTSRQGVLLTLSGSSPSPAVNDHIVVEKFFPGDPAAGWWTEISGGATMTAEYSDLPAGTAGRQALRIEASGSGQRAILNSYFDSLEGRSFIQLNGSYRLSFRAKGMGGRNSVNVQVQRFGAQTYLSRAVTIGTSWSNYNIDFTAAETGSTPGTIQLQLDASGSNVLLDDVSLERTSGSPANTTAFRDEVVDTLKALQPGLIRYMASATALGIPLDDWIAPAFGRRRGGYSAWSSRQEDITYGLHEFLELSSHVGAEPWITVPLTFSAEEMRGLVEYLGGGSTSTYGAKRTARGQSAPWTTVFPTIHIELGNETWNGLFKGAAMEISSHYGGRIGDMYSAARSANGFSAARFNLIVGGQAAWAGRNEEILAAASQYDSLAVAPYLLFDVNGFSSPEQMFGSLFAEPQLQSTTAGGWMRQNATVANTASPQAKLAVYEVNLHTTGGSISQGALDQLTPSAGAGVAVANHMLMMLRELGVRDQALFALPQFNFARSDGKSVKLWGSVVDMGVTNRKRPQFLAMQMANQVLAGNMVRTTHSGADPAWNQADQGNGIVLNGAKYIQSYATVNGNSRAAIVMNLHRTSSLPVTFSGEAPRGSVSVTRLSAPSITANNESGEQVTISSEVVSSFDSSTEFVLPPYSMTVLSWSASGGTTAPSAPVLSGITVSQIQQTSAVITWTTDKPAQSIVRYGTSSPATPINAGGLRTSHSVTLTGLQPGTAYQFTAASTDAGNRTTTSTVRTFRTLSAPDDGGAALVISALAASQLTSSSATISWTTNLASTAAVEYGVTTALGTSSPVSPAAVTSHRVPLSGLPAGAKIYFRAISRTAAGVTARSTIGSFQLPAAADSRRPIISYLRGTVSRRNLVITWMTNEPTTGQVLYGPTNALGREGSVVRTLTTTHRIVIPNLAPGPYFARVRSIDAAGNITLSGLISVLIR